MSPPSLIETRARTSCRKFAPQTFWRVTTEKLRKRRPGGFNLAKHWDHVAILQENKDELYFTIRRDDADGALSLEEQASLTYNQVTIKKTGSIRVVNKYGLIHFILKHGQVSANFDLLLKWFTVFGRDTPTGTELKACPAQCMKILNFQWLLWCMLWLLCDHNYWVVLWSHNSHNMHQRFPTMPRPQHNISPAIAHPTKS